MESGFLRSSYFLIINADNENGLGYKDIIPCRTEKEVRMYLRQLFANNEYRHYISDPIKKLMKWNSYFITMSSKTGKNVAPGTPGGREQKIKFIVINNTNLKTLYDFFDSANGAFADTVVTIDLDLDEDNSADVKLIDYLETIGQDKTLQPPADDAQEPDSEQKPAVAHTPVKLSDYLKKVKNELELENMIEIFAQTWIEPD